MPRFGKSAKKKDEEEKDEAAPRSSRRRSKKAGTRKRTSRRRDEEPEDTGEGDGEEEEEEKRTSSKRSRGKKPGFMMRGKAARQEREKAEKRAKERRERAASAYRFWIGKDDDGERRITFLDGDLDDDGMLDIPYLYEHNVPYEGRFSDFRCTKAVDGECPLCEAGDEPSYVGVLTVLDMCDGEEGRPDPWEDSDGKEHFYRRRLYVAKLQTLKKLQRYADKHDGLAGCTFDVSRDGKQSARVGSNFDFVEKEDLEDIAGDLEKPEHADPADYENEPELEYKSPEELLELGLGEKGEVVGARGSKSRKGRKRRAIDDEMGD